MTPRISDKPFYRLTIPELSGGINYRDGISLIGDNQLADARNVWYKDGLLRTRPGIQCVTPDELIEQYMSAAGCNASMEGKVHAYPKIIWVENGITYRLVVTVSHIGISFHWVADEHTYIDMCTISVMEYPAEENPHINVVQFNDKIYCFISGYYEDNGDIAPYDLSVPYFIFRIGFDTAEGWGYIRIEDDDVYIPTVAINCLPRLSDRPSVQELGISGDLIEGYNLIGSYYNLIYSTGRNDQDETFMVYPLIESTLDPDLGLTKDEFIGKNVTATITDENGRVWKHSVTLDSSEFSEETESPGDGLYMEYDGYCIRFLKRDADGMTVATVSKSKFLLNNMVITMPRVVTKENVRKVMDMTFSEWFGGGAQGIYGGLHLFMGGNTNDNEKSLVIWSDFNKPLYFSENAYAYVGNTSQKVTAFGKQGEALIIFKEQETYATQYTSIDDVMSAEAVMNQAIVDVAASEVTFPMVQVHGSIGCDCPGTVQLCRNRLVWAYSSGKVYTLVSANQWNERSIFELSAMVEPLLKTCTLTTAQSADWDGHYVLASREYIFVMDYNCYGYTHVASYTKDEDAQKLIPWWVWETPTKCPAPGAMMALNGDQLAFWSVLTAEDPDRNRLFWPEMLIFDGVGDSVPYVYGDRERLKAAYPVRSMTQTKLFDFGSPTIKKTVPKSEISFGANGGTPITVTTITDKGQTQTDITVDGDETEERQPRFFTSVVVRNAARHGNRIGYKFECDGNLYLDALSIHYKHLGGAK